MNGETVFEKIVAGELPSYPVYEDDRCMAILNIMPEGRGHTLVIPKEHYVNVFDIPADLAAHIGGVTAKVAQHLKEVLGAEGCHVFQNSTRLAGQAIDHYHMHIVPRYSGDGVKISCHGETYSIGETELMELQKTISM